MDSSRSSTSSVGSHPAMPGEDTDMAVKGAQLGTVLFQTVFSSPPFQLCHVTIIAKSHLVFGSISLSLKTLLGCIYILGRSVPVRNLWHIHDDEMARNLRKAEGGRGLQSGLCSPLALLSRLVSRSSRGLDCQKTRESECMLLGHLMQKFRSRPKSLIGRSELKK